MAKRSSKARQISRGIPALTTSRTRWARSFGELGSL